LYMADEVDDGRGPAPEDKEPCGSTSCRSSLKLGLLGPCLSADKDAGLAMFGAGNVADVENLTVDGLTEPTDAMLRESIRKLKKFNVTLLKICKLSVLVTQKVTLIMEELDFNVFAIMSDVSLVPTFSELNYQGWWQGSSFLEPVAWDESRQTRGSFSNWTSTDFVENFVSDFGYRPTPDAAAQFAGLCALAKAVEATGSVSTAIIRAALTDMELDEFYAKVSFDEYGQAKHRFLIRQSPVVKRSGAIARGTIAYSADDALVRTFVFPMPPWAQTRCRFDINIDFEACSGHGECSKTGGCVCVKGWVGASCSDEVKYPFAETEIFKIILIVLGLLFFVLAVIGVFRFVSRQRKLRIQIYKQDLETAIADRAEAVQQKLMAQLHHLGYSMHEIQGFVTSTRKRQSEQSGICLAYLLSPEFLKLAQERSGKEDPTFYDLKDCIFFGDNPIGKDQACPRDGLKGVALVDALEKHQRGQCTHFLSWTWGYKVSTVTGALQQWLDGMADGTRAEEVFFFMCFFVNNQYRILVNNEKIGAADLERVFEENLKRIGKVVAVLDSWDSPRYLTRIWTIFEQVVAIKLNVPVTMVLPADASRSCLDEFENGKAGIIRVKNSLTKVHSQSAEAFAPEDEAAVKDLIKKTIPGGFKEVDKKIIHFMIRWVGDQMEMHMRSLVTTNGETQCTQGSFTVCGGEVEVEVIPSSPPSLRDLSLS